MGYKRREGYCLPIAGLEMRGKWRRDPIWRTPRRNKAKAVWGTSETEGDSCGVRYRQHIPSPTSHQDTTTLPYNYSNKQFLCQ